MHLTGCYLQINLYSLIMLVSLTYDIFCLCSHRSIFVGLGCIFDTCVCTIKASLIYPIQIRPPTGSVTLSVVILFYATKVHMIYSVSTHPRSIAEYRFIRELITSCKLELLCMRQVRYGMRNFTIDYHVITESSMLFIGTAFISITNVSTLAAYNFKLEETTLQ